MKIWYNEYSKKDGLRMDRKLNELLEKADAYKERIDAARPLCHRNAAGLLPDAGHPDKRYSVKDG